MATHKVKLLPEEKTVEVPSGTLITEAAASAGLEITQPCGGQGRCGRCAVKIEEGTVRRRSTIRLNTDDLNSGWALACQSLIEGDAVVSIPEQERIERHLVTEQTARAIELPFDYLPAEVQSIQTYKLSLTPPSLDDSKDDLTRLQSALQELSYHPVEISLSLLQRIGSVLRESDWEPHVLLETPTPGSGPARLIEIGASPFHPHGLALDIGTTTVTAYLVDLISGKVKASAAEYNGQIARGEDVISRIIFAGKGNGLDELGTLVRGTIQTVLEKIQRRTGIPPDEIYKVTVAGNTTMIHLFLRLPPETIRLTPYIPAVNHPPRFLARDLDLPFHPLASVDCLPGVASYVGADISAGVLASGLAESDSLTLFIDVGTNGEIVLGTRDWMLTCACSAGPAFEGAGVVDGMRATQGAIEEVWVHSETFEPTYRVIGGGKPRGICGSGLISLLSELFVTGVIDRSGSVKLDLDTPRVREGDHGPEYVVTWADDSDTKRDIVLSKVDVDNLMRTKAAIYAGYTVLAASIGVDLADVQQVLVGGAFGKYINIENAINIGLLPDLPWESFHFLGNTAALGTYMGLLSNEVRGQIREIANRMTYMELSADNSFYDAFTAALFLPHTDINRFPNVAKIWEEENGHQEEEK
ncbi:MAG TPA: ASKHA domain-containing protein [Anaerolineales bacterium]|nr:ASKHA domain-containing protein [Anaerolineales bacterium]HUS84546.1 ASKHA domain-containing protein [Anaerolineales bacterium]